MKQAHTYLEALEAAHYLRRRWAKRPRVGIILGSGLGGAVSRLSRAKAIPYRLVPHFPAPKVSGHAGTLHVGMWGKTPVAVLEGRSHLYEGYTPAEIVLPTRALALAGVEVLIVTCAAGGIVPKAAPGRLMIFSDHLNLQGQNPLAGWHDARLGPRFVDLSHAYDPVLRQKAKVAARALHLKCFEGVYAALLGPSYETPAEIRALRRLGADAVGMSAVPEVLAARQLGVRALALAVITNRAAGLAPRPLNHREVLAAGKKAAASLRRLLDALLPEFR